MEPPNKAPEPQPATTPSKVTPASPLASTKGQVLLDDLIRQIDQKADAAEYYGSSWSRIRLATMLSLIVLSAIVAADKTFASWFSSVPRELTIGISICSILVAIGTAFDQSVKPGTRWRLSSGYATKFRGLKLKAQMIDATNADAINQLSDDFQVLDQKWLDDTTV
jgi:hypothetical protein